MAFILKRWVLIPVAIETIIESSILNVETGYTLDGRVTLANWRPFYEAQFGVEIFVEFYESTL